MKNTYLLILVLLLITGGFIFLKIQTSNSTANVPVSPTPAIQKPTPTSSQMQPFVSHGLRLDIISPSNNAVASSSSLIVSGKTTPNAEVFINALPLKADATGSFKQTVTLDLGENTIDVVANDETGNYAENILTVSYMQPTTQKPQLLHLTDAKVSAIKGATVTITKDGKEYIVSTTPTTKLRKLYPGAIKLSDMKVNDLVSLFGSYINDAHTSIDALLIRDTTLVSQEGVFFGTVNTMQTSGFVLQTLNRGSIPVAIEKTTKIVNKKNTPFVSDIKNGDTVRVSGIFDKIRIDEVALIKDFASIEASSTPSAKAH